MKSLITKNPGIEYFKQQLNQKLSEIEVDETLLYNETSYDIYIYCVIHYEKQLLSDHRMPVDEAKDMIDTIVTKVKIKGNNMTLNNLLSHLEDASVDSSGEIYEWLETHHIDRDEAIALHDEIELAGKVEEEWEVYEALLMYIDYNREWDD